MKLVIFEITPIAQYPHYRIIILILSFLFIKSKLYILLAINNDVLSIFRKSFLLQNYIIILYKNLKIICHILIWYTTTHDLSLSIIHFALTLFYLYNNNLLTNQYVAAIYCLQISNYIMEITSKFAPAKTKWFIIVLFSINNQTLDTFINSFYIYF